MIRSIVRTATRAVLLIGRPGDPGATAPSPEIFRVDFPPRSGTCVMIPEVRMPRNTEVTHARPIDAQGPGPGYGPVRILGRGPGPGLERLPALALYPAAGPRQRVRIRLPVRRVLSLPARAADRPPDPGALLPQLLRRQARDGDPPLGRRRRDQPQEDLLRGQSFRPRRLLSDPPRSRSADRRGMTRLVGRPFASGFIPARSPFDN